MNIRIITLLFAVFPVLINATAKKLANLEQTTPKVLSMKLATSSFIPAGDQRKDNNGDLCALVKVQVLDDFTEESSSIGDVVKRSNAEKWVYVYKGAKRMKLFFKNNLPLTVTFSDYGIQSLESNRVYELQIQVPIIPTSDSGNKGTLRLNVSPASAEVTISDDKSGRTVYRPQIDGTLTLTLPWGRYSYSVTAEGHNKFDGSVFISDRASEETIKLTPIMGRLTVVCPTERLDYYIDDALMGTGQKTKNWTIELAPGQHMVTILRKGYVSQTKNVIINANQNITVTFEKLSTEKELESIQKQKEKEIRAAEKAKARAARPQLVHSSDFYILPMVQAGSLMGAGLAAGGNMTSINVEAAYIFGFDSSEDIYWNYSGTEDRRPEKCSYKPSVFSLRFGYGIIVGKEFRVTPQLGVDMVQISADDSKCNVTSAMLGLRADYALTKGFALFAAPQIGFAVKKSSIYEQLDPLSDKIKSWSGGFNVRAGLMIFF